MQDIEERPVARKGERKYQVFISSTFGDLADQRRVALDVVIDRGHMPIALERFPAVDSAVPYVIQKAIETSQIYIVILGFRYGAMADSSTSFTHLEYKNALEQKKIVVVPFLLTDEEVHNGRKKIQEQMLSDQARLAQLKAGTPEYSRLEQEIAYLGMELTHEKELWDFRSEVRQNRFSRQFSLKKGSSEQFDKYMVLAALLKAEEAAEQRRIAGWIREPEERELAEAVAAVSQNRFFVDVVRAMAKFDPLAPRVRGQTEQKQAAATFFAERYLEQLQEKRANLFFESGSTIAYVALVVGERLGTHDFGNEIQISTNNVLAYLIFWLVHGIRCSLFPWGTPEKQYGAVFGRINELVSEKIKPSFPPEPLSKRDLRAIDLLSKDHYSPAAWSHPTLLLGALSGLQLEKDDKAFNCLGPHVGSPRNKVFKRFMYATKHPVMLFMTADKVDCPVKPEHCHFILEQEENGHVPESKAAFLGWQMFCTERPVAFCVGCETSKAEDTAKRFLDLGFQIVGARHKTDNTAFIARNQKFIDEFERAMDIQEHRKPKSKNKSMDL